MKNLSLVLLAMLALPAGATTWNCRNADMEVACSEGECHATVDHGFTPMDVAFNDDGSISVCAYAGCWEGEGEVFTDGRFLSIAARGLVYSTDQERGTDQERRHDLAILLDLDDNVAMLKSGVFAQPLICRVLEDAPTD